MSNNSLLRIGVFYDGSYFTKAQNFYYKDKDCGWLMFIPLHKVFEQFIAEKEKGFASYRIVHSAWFQGLNHHLQEEDKSKEKHDSEQEQLRLFKKNRSMQIALIDAGIEMKYQHNNSEKREKGVDVSFAINVMQLAINDKIDIAILITADEDFVPLVRDLMKLGKRVLLFYFDYTNDEERNTASSKLINLCNYSLCFNEVLSHNKYSQGLFKPKNDKNDKQD